MTHDAQDHHKLNKTNKMKNPRTKNMITSNILVNAQNQLFGFSFKIETRRGKRERKENVNRTSGNTQLKTFHTNNSCVNHARLLSM